LEVERIRSPCGRLIITLCALLLLSSPVAASEDVAETTGEEEYKDAETRTGALIVQVRGLTSSDGILRFVLFDSKQDFLQRPVRAEIVEIGDMQATWTIDELAYGTYAVLVHHDVDESGKMERHWYGKPKEPTGASNDAPARFGPPKFKDAKFELESPRLTLVVTVR
jgi:uncharacterized protein (DUF2141 family)